MFNGNGHREAMFDRMMARAAKMDPIRSEPLVQLRVISRSTGVVVAGATIDMHAPEARVLERGVFETQISVYESDVHEVMKLVETASEDDMRRVREHLDAEFAEWTTGAPGQVARSADTFPGSFEGSFRKVMRRDVRPLLLCERIDATASAETPPEGAPERKRGARS